MDSSAKFFFFVKQKCKEFPAFSPLLEVKFLVDSNSCSNNKSFTNAIVVPPSNSSCCNTRHTHTYANNSDDGQRASARAVCVVQLLSMGDSRTERFVYYCQHLTVVAVSVVRTFNI